MSTSAPDSPAALAAFVTEVRDWFARDYPQDILAKTRSGSTLERDDMVRSQAALGARGWAAPHWPVEHGGPGWSALQRQIFETEFSRAGVPTIVPMGLIYVAPVIYTFGTPEQQARWLPDILHSRKFWAQGYSEPQAGSDLAALATRAVLEPAVSKDEGDDYIVTGHKTWTSLGHYADWIFCLVRTSDAPKATGGISFLCIDIKSPGVTVRPIYGLDGRAYLAEVIFDHVRVPVSNRIGEEGSGWSTSKYLLANERTWYARVEEKRIAMRSLRALAAQVPAPDCAIGLDPAFRRKMAQADIAITALEALVERARAGGPNGAGDLASLIKIMATETAQAITELLLELAGDLGAPHFPVRGAGWADALPGRPSFAVPAVADYFMARAQTIYGGSTEVQKNIIARTVLGL